MRIPPVVYGIFVVVIFFGTILGFQRAGVWSVSGKITSSGEAVQPSAADVDSIKGWMTLEQIATTYDVSLEDILKQFDLPPDTAPSTAIKDLETDLFSVTNLRDWLQGRIEPAQPVLTDEPVSTPTQELPSVPTVTETAPLATPLPVDHTPTDKTITGKTTFSELLDWGVPQEAIEKIIGGDIPAPALVIKDYVTEKGEAFSTIKTSLQAEVDKTK